MLAPPRPPLAAGRIAATIVAGILIAALVPIVRPALAQDGTPLGANVEGLLAAGRRLSPMLQAAALATEAASARSDAAGAVPDPTFMINDDEVDRTSGPRINKTYFMFGQMFPLWGKRDLQHQAALRAVEASRGQERVTRDQLDEQIKVAFAQYYAVSRGIAVNADIARLARQMTRAAESRYGQGQGSQTAAILATTEGTRAATEAVRLEGNRAAAIARINALLARPAEAPLVAPLALRPIPPALPPIANMVERARAANPQVFSAQAEIQQAETQRRLAGKAWYPDVTITAGPIERQNGPTGYSATLSLSIPLQQGSKDAGVREAAANLGVARMRLDAAIAQIQGDLGQAVAALSTASKVESALRMQLLPQYQAAYRSTLASYGQGRGELTAVLESEHRLHETNLDILRTQLDAQTALAAIERLIGGEL
jgi:cobalt-zinc-cadmium efflux system outer membrane protein